MSSLDVARAAALARQTAVALALAADGDTTGATADLVPQAVWDELHRQGWVKTEQDHTGEGFTFATPAGVAALRDMLES